MDSLEHLDLVRNTERFAVASYALELDQLHCILRMRDEMESKHHFAEATLAQKTTELKLKRRWRGHDEYRYRYHPCAVDDAGSHE